MAWCRVLHEFIATHRDTILTRTRARVASRPVPRPTDIEIVHGVPLFLDQLAARLQADADPEASQIGSSASLHGSELLSTGFTIGQVVHDYGNICQVITQLAVELNAQISNAEFRTLNLCLDVGIAQAVTEYARQREQLISDRGIEHLGFLAHELRNHLSTATLAFEAVRSGSVGADGGTGGLVARSLDAMRDLVNRSLAEVRLEAGLPQRDRIPVARLLEEVEIAASMQAKGRDIELSIEPVEANLAVEGDFQILVSIMSNLVQNACKFTRARGHVAVRTRVIGARVAIDVADECGGLPPGTADELFQPYKQRGSDRSGLGLGLAISLKGARAIGGELKVRDLPGTGCVFTVELRKSPAV